MTLSGELMIGGTSKTGPQKSFQAINPETGAALEPAYGGAGPVEIESACRLAEQAFASYRRTNREQRAALLEAIATQIEALGDALVARAMLETGLPRGRIEGERGRTTGQLRLFADVVREGSWLGLRLDSALPERKPAPRPDLRLRNIPLGPVAIFGASNFPLAFSVAGGDTASALAAGCPVVVKAHPAHPGTSELVGRAIRAAIAETGLAEGVFSLLFGVGNDLGSAMVSDPRIKAVGFTGSRAGGLALMALAAKRAEPIPVYAEMSSINPTIILPAALEARSKDIAAGYVASLTMGAGQFCTNPGLVIVQDGPQLETFIAAAKAALEASAASTMLHPGIFQAYQAGVERIETAADVALLARGQDGTNANQGRAALFVVQAKHFLANRTLSEEVFGASSVIVTCPDFAAVQDVLATLEGQLTVTLQLADADMDKARALLPLLEDKAGRVLVNGWPTGVEVSHAMVHGGPFPSTSDSRTTSVGTLAIHRFLRPVCYQNFPDSLLPGELRDGGSAELVRRVDGKLQIPNA